jgi:hypothetical protein
MKNLKILPQKNVKSSKKGRQIDSSLIPAAAEDRKARGCINALILRFVVLADVRHALARSSQMRIRTKVKLVGMV